MSSASDTPRPTGPAKLRDVAALAKVDISIASRVLSGTPRLAIRPDTRQRVIDAADQLDYTPNTTARNLRKARTMTIGLLLPDLFNAALAIAEGAEARAIETGYLLWIGTGALSERVEVLGGRIDGLLVASATSHTTPRARTGLPMLLVNRYEEASGIQSVVVDDAAGVRIAIDYLTSIGHTRLGHVMGPQSIDTGRRRRAGFLEGLARAGIAPREDWMVEGPYSESGGYAAATRILSSDDRPTALLVSNITQSIGALSAVRQLGLRVPGDVSVVGYDDVTLAQYLDPPLTTVRMPLRELGAMAVDQLIRMIRGERVSNLVVPAGPELVVRGSASPPCR